MKNIVKMLNALDKCPHTTMQEKIIKEDGLRAMWATINKAWPDAPIKYVPGKGYKWLPKFKVTLNN